VRRLLAKKFRRHGLRHQVTESQLRGVVGHRHFQRLELLEAERSIPARTSGRRCAEILEAPWCEEVEAQEIGNYDTGRGHTRNEAM
jgi:hypothetical protein